MRFASAWAFLLAAGCTAPGPGPGPEGQTATCNDGERNGLETDVDCGGFCAKKCAALSACGWDGDCASLRCAGDGKCVEPACDDRLLNGDETAPDCGGSCPAKCAEGAGCGAGADCAQGVCGEDHRCAEPSCGDHVKNGDETGADCGGPCETKCAPGAGCAEAGDCIEGVCGEDHLCAAPTCPDGVRNGDESDLDCGGSCATACANNLKCGAPVDCASGVCGDGDPRRCAVPNCDDDVKNGGESDVDCGVACPTRCADHGHCVLATDCASGVCTPADHTCAEPLCTDGVFNGTEAGRDCGGTCPDACVTTGNIFTPDAGALAIFELNGDVADATSNHRDAVLIGGTFEATPWGEGLRFTADPQGFDWSAYASLIVHPYTIEWVVDAGAGFNCWSKIFGWDDANEAGWYYCEGFFPYPRTKIGGADFPAGRHYLAVVSTAADAITVYYNGTLLGSGQAALTAPPAHAIFFRDDSHSGRDESFPGLVDAVRISSVTRTAEEIAAVQAKLSPP